MYIFGWLAILWRTDNISSNIVNKFRYFVLKSIRSEQFSTVQTRQNNGWQLLACTRACQEMWTVIPREHVPHWQWPVEGDSRMESGKSESASDVKALKSKTGRTTRCVCQMHTVHCWVKWLLGCFTYCVVCVCVCVCTRQISITAQVTRSSPFWDVAQGRCVVSYGRFWTIYRTLEDRTGRLFRNADT
jgi:hypothetical protein